LVGQSAKGCKGQIWSTPRHIFSEIDAVWGENCVKSGLSSGEGLIYHVRDPRVQQQPVKGKRRAVSGQAVTLDRGVTDKRLLIVEEEFAQALKLMAREGNILSPVLRQAWDSGDLHSLVKNDPTGATGAHISIIAHITQQELLRHLNDTEQANGFANRFLWASVRRSNVIPDPTGIPAQTLEPLVQQLQRAVQAATQIGEMRRDESAAAYWRTIYVSLSAEMPGLLGAIAARAEAQVMRLACLYAVLDRSPVVSLAHLQAALAVWRFSEASVGYLFGDHTGDPVADRILQALDERAGMDLTGISQLFGRNMKQERLALALRQLRQAKLIVEEHRPTKGRPGTIIRRTRRER
jgi:hypothetical protein